MKDMLRKYQIYQNLRWLNELTFEEAEAAFYGCSHSEAWARLVTAARPFRSLDDLFTRAEGLWRSVESTENTDAMLAGLEKLLER